jgi:hypothetical protein
MKEEESSKSSIWMTIAITAIGFVVVLAALAGFLLGHFTGGSGSSTAMAGQAGGEASAPQPGRQVFIGPGTIGPTLNESLSPDDTAASVKEMIVDPEAEIAEGYSGGIMPQTYGESLSEEELEQLVQFLVANSPAK